MPDWENVLITLADHVQVFMTAIRILMDDQDITRLRQIVHTTSCGGIKVDATRGDGPTW